MVTKWMKIAAIWSVIGLFTTVFLTLLDLGYSAWLSNPGHHLTVSGALFKAVPHAALGSLWGFLITYFIDRRAAKRSR